MKRLVLIVIAALALAATASASTPWKQGDPRKCSFNRPAYCGDLSARAAFKTKFQRARGTEFIGQLQCPSSAPLTYMCAWKNGVGGGQALVRFADKASGWVVSVGTITG